MNSLRVRDVIEKLNINRSSVLGNLNKILGSAAALINITSNQFTFCKEKNVNMLSSIYNCVVVVPKLNLPMPPNNTYILVDNPRLTFLRIMKFVYPDGVKPQITIGKNVQIEPNVVIGAHGFGFERNEEGKLEKFPQIGGVIIGDDVEIQAFSNVDRGTIDNTIIGRGTKIDSYCHIGHNVVIGKHCDIRAKAMFAGSVTLKDYVTIAPGTNIMNGVTIGKNSFVGLGATVIKDVPDNVIVAGVPAKELRANDYEF